MLKRSPGPKSPQDLKTTHPSPVGSKKAPAKAAASSDAGDGGGCTCGQEIGQKVEAAAEAGAPASPEKRREPDEYREK